MPGLTLHLIREGDTAHLLIDRAAKRNAFDLAMWQALPGLLDEARDARLLIVRAAEPGNRLLRRGRYTRAARQQG